MGKFLAIVGGFAGGFIVGWSIVLLIYIISTEYFGYFDRDGGGAMAALFMIGPFLGIIFGIAGMIFIARRMRQKAVQSERQ